MPILAWKTGERLILNCKATSLPCSTPAQPHVQTCQCGRPPSSVSCTPCCLVRCIALAREFCGTSVVVNSVVYTNKAGSLVGIEPTTVLFGFGEDIERRSTALETIKQNDVAFTVATAVKSLPIGGQGSAVHSRAAEVRQPQAQAVWRPRRPPPCVQSSASFITPLHSWAVRNLRATPQCRTQCPSQPRRLPVRSRLPPVPCETNLSAPSFGAGFTRNSNGPFSRI